MLPELTEEERVAMEKVDMTEVLGSWEEQCKVAMNAAIRFMRQRNKLREILLLIKFGTCCECDHSKKNECQVYLVHKIIDSALSELSVAKEDT